MDDFPLNGRSLPLGRTLMIQGTSSSAGKSLLVTGLCRLYARRGVRVAPFKAQNMSNNAAVCADGGEIGRSQALQAQAARIAPTIDMNPILLKPEGDCHSQVIVHGTATQSVSAGDYFKHKRKYWTYVTQSLDRLRDHYELVIIEGAGSPAELNFNSVEIVNMAVARYCDSPVILAGDIERGGVFAQLLGTLWLLEPEERALVKGLLVNKFRGDLRLFDQGVEILEQRGQVPVLGVLPWLKDLHLPEEDAVALHTATSSIDADDMVASVALDVVVIHLPHIANFDDFDPIAREPGVRLRYIADPRHWGEPDVVIIPGTKNTLADLRWMREAGLADRVVRHAAMSKTTIGICGGYQILGQSIQNPNRLESDEVEAVGLGLLPVTTLFEASKRTLQVTAEVISDSPVNVSIGHRLEGYEIHVGRTHTPNPWLKLYRKGTDGESVCLDGARSQDGCVWGCYLHGLFQNDAFRTMWIQGLGKSLAGSCNSLDAVEASLDRLADALLHHLDIATLDQIIWHQELPHARN